METIKFGIIGCGMISKWHAEAIKSIQGVELRGATDVNTEAAAVFGKKHGVRMYESVDSLLTDPKIQIVSICVPSGLHALLAVQAARAGKHIVVEKPMAITVEQCDQIIAACDKNKVKVAVISQLRFSPVVTRLKEAVQKGRLGKLVTGDIFMKFYRSQEYYDKGGWKGTWAMDGGGALMNQGIHGIDLLQYIMGPVRSVTGYIRTLVNNIEVEDTACALVEFTNGALGVVQGATSTFPGLPRRLEICGDKGTVVLEEDRVVFWRIKDEGVDKNSKRPVVFTVPNDKNVAENNKSKEAGLNDNIHDKTNTASNPASFGIGGHVKQIRDMVDAVLNDAQPFIDQHEGRKPVEIITAIYKSSQTGRTVYLN